MLDILLKGFTIGIAYVAPIGMQNLYVINTAMTQSKKRVYQVAFITILFDISLALACFFGIGLIINNVEILKTIIYGVGSLAVIWIGISLIKSTPNMENNNIDLNIPLRKVALSCFLVTWANPQALIDGTLLFGGFRASLQSSSSTFFIIGACLASATWFLLVATITSIFKNAINEKILKGINIICGAILIYYGLKLGYNFILEIGIF